MVFNATFKNISVISWWSVLLVEETRVNISVISWLSVLLVEETGVLGENHRLSRVTDKLYHIMFIEYSSSERDSNSQLQW